jgi:hypothetical protein
VKASDWIKNLFLIDPKKHTYSMSGPEKTTSRIARPMEIVKN